MPRQPQGRWFCERCQRRFDAAGGCERCPGEPLLDLADDDVRQFVEDEDARRAHKRLGLAVGVSLPLAIVVAFILGAGIVGIAAGVGLGVGLSAAVVALFPAKKRAPTVSPAQLEAWRAG